MQAAVADSRQERLAVVAAVGQSSSRQQQQEDRAVADRSSSEQESIAVADSRQERAAWGSSSRQLVAVTSTIEGPQTGPPPRIIVNMSWTKV